MNASAAATVVKNVASFGAFALRRAACGVQAYGGATARGREYARHGVGSGRWWAAPARTPPPRARLRELGPTQQIEGGDRGGAARHPARRRAAGALPRVRPTIPLY